MPTFLRSSDRLFLVSFFLLFLELACIRWIPAQVRYMGYFTNFILLASFLGMGLGCLLAGSKRNWLEFFPLLLLMLIAGATYSHVEAGIQSPLMLYFTEYWRNTNSQQVDTFYLLPMLFLIVAVLFIPPAQAMGRLMQEFPSLEGYRINLIGSLAGIATFSLLSYHQTSPFLWFLLLGVIVLALLEGSTLSRVMNVVLLILSLGILYHQAQGAHWSPYYKITLSQTGTPPAQWLVINVNDVGHQDLADIGRKEFFYHFPYQIASNPPKDILVIGAGCGNDLAAALLNKTASIDAVEIDPFIVDLGREFHPNRPYDDPRVSVHINDGRQFLKTASKTYDLIVFAVIDSLTLTSAFSSVRLENYLFTLESFQEARSRLKEKGIIVIYNYFREQWLVDKLAGMLGQVFQNKPYRLIEPRTPNLAILVAGNDLSPFHFPSPSQSAVEAVPPSTDDWPFIYLKTPSIPGIYLKALGVLLLITIVCVFTLSTVRQGFHPHFFFLGSGFMLLETRSVITFSLLFGSTWIVNALVFFAILTAALVSTWAVARFRPGASSLLYCALGGLLVLNFLFPEQSLHLENQALRYLVASLLAFSPILIAGLIFSNSMNASVTPALALGSNLLGGMLGGMLEYSSLKMGYQFLLLLIFVLYGLSWLSMTGKAPAEPATHS